MLGARLTYRRLHVRRRLGLRMPSHITAGGSSMGCRDGLLKMERVRWVRLRRLGGGCGRVRHALLAHPLQVHRVRVYDRRSQSRRRRCCCVSLWMWRRHAYCLASSARARSREALLESCHFLASNFDETCSF